MRIAPAACLLACLACAHPAPATPAAAATDCAPTSRSTLPGVAIAVGGPCRFTLAQARAGLRFPYEVRIEQDVDGVAPTPQGSGGCGEPGDSGLIVFGRIDGGGQSYCLCDTGLCPDRERVPGKLPRGRYAGTFEWDGMSWNGPSDTGQPKGAPFPPGTYTLTLSAVGGYGTGNFEVVGTYQITLVP